MLDISDHEHFGGGGSNDPKHENLEVAISNAMTNYHFVGSVFSPCTFCYPMSVMTNIFMDHFKDMPIEQAMETLEKLRQFIKERLELHNLTKGKKN